MSLESSEDPRRRRLLDDPLAIRAMAHPVRLDLLSLLGREGPLTAADAARRLGISQALASHHLRQLAKYDFVEPAQGKDNRERPWRAVSTSQTWADADLSPEAVAAAEVLEQLMAERALDELAGWQKRRAGEEPAWRQNAGIGRTGIYLTRDEFVELEEQMQALVMRYVDERPIDDKSTRPPGSRLVEITRIVVVHPEDAPQEDTALEEER